MSEPTEFLDLDDLLTLAERLLGSAAARPQTSVFGADAYGEIWTKAAALLQSIVKYHPLVDGNQRLGWIAIAVLLELNGVAATTAANDAVYELMMTVAAGHHSVDEIAAMIRSTIETD